MSEYTFKELAEVWFEQNAVGLCYSYRTEILSLIQHMNSFMGSENISEIKPIEITAMVNSLASVNPNTGRPMAKGTLYTLTNTISRIFEMAIDNDWLVKNPARGKSKAIPRNAPTKKVTSISKTEQRLIVQTPHRCRLAALIMMLTGLRTGELLALSWSDIDLDSKRLNVCKHAVKTSPNCYQIMPGTKTGKTRFVNIPDNMCIYLRSERKNAKSPIVFPKTDGSYNTPSSWSSAWKSYMNTINHYYSDSGASKFDPHGYPKLIHINPHQLRHTYATLTKNGA